MVIYFLLGLAIGLLIKSAITEFGMRIVLFYLKDNPKYKQMFKDRLKEILEK